MIFVMGLNHFTFAQWLQVGANLGFASSGAAPSLAFNPATAEAYIAYPDGAANAFVVQKFNGTNWIQVGANLGFASSGSVPSLAFHPTTNEAYIAYRDGAANAFVVQKYNGTNWTQVGANLGFASNGAVPSLAFNPTTNEAYAAYPDGAANAFVVQKFNGTNWTQVGANLGFASNPTAPSLAFNASTNEAYLAYPDGAANAFVVQKFNGTNWTQVGANLGFASSGVAPSLAFNPTTNEAYVAYPDGAANAFAVQKFNGTNWTQVGANLGFASGGFSVITAPSLAFNPITNEANVAYPDGGANVFVVQKFNGTSWTQVGANLGSTGGNVAISLTFKPCHNEAYLAYPDAAANAFVVEKFDLGCTLSITTQPANQSISIGNNAQFSVSSSYPCALTYQWQTDLGLGYQNITDAGQYSGATNDTLTVSSVTLSNNNQLFRCIVSSGSCSDTSIVATLTVINDVGINILSDENSFVVYPNPASDLITVNVNSNLLSSAYFISDMLGRTVLKGKLTSKSSDINIYELSAGIYILKVGEYNQRTYKLLRK